jgi:hypothetical protein
MIIFFILSSKLNRVSTLPLDETMTVLSYVVSFSLLI